MLIKKYSRGQRKLPQEESQTENVLLTKGLHISHVSKYPYSNCSIILGVDYLIQIDIVSNSWYELIDSDL